MNIYHLLGFNEKRLGRLSYFTNQIAGVMLFLGLGMLLMLILFVIIPDEYEETVISFALFPLALSYWAFLIMLTIRRLHDLGLDAWFTVLAYTPFIGFFFGLYLFFAKGNEEKNKYGKPQSNLTILGFYLSSSPPK